MKKYDTTKPVVLKKGVYQLNDESNFNYQLNRVIDWGIKHGCYAYEAKDAYGYAKKLKLYDLEPVADRITQDMLIVGANQDHFIDYRMVGREINMLKNVKSLTFRLFTDEEDAQNHCNVGNGKLVIDTICDWIQQISSEE